MKPEKAAKLKENRDKVSQMVSEYINPEPKNNTGQLKFLSGLLTGNLAVTIGVKLRKDKRFLDYLDKNILKDNEEALSFFDLQKNTEAFVKASCYDLEEVYEGFCPEPPVPLYLLLEKAQKAMERECLYYLGLPGNGDACLGEERKKEAYTEWLFSIALYEIFVIAYGRVISKEQKEYREQKPDERLMQEVCPEVFCYRDREKLEQQKEALWECVNREYQRLKNQGLTVLYIDCFFRHVFNLYAMLRLVAMIEFVRIEDGLWLRGMELKNRDKTAEMEADIWQRLLDRHGRYHLFTTVELNPNLVAYARRFRDMYQKNQLTPHAQEEKGVGEFIKEYYNDKKAVTQYIELLKARKESDDYRWGSEKTENGFWNICVPFAWPVLYAVHEIAELKE